MTVVSFRLSEVLRLTISFISIKFIKIYKIYVIALIHIVIKNLTLNFTAGYCDNSMNCKNAEVLLFLNFAKYTKQSSFKFFDM